MTLLTMTLYVMTLILSDCIASSFVSSLCLSVFCFFLFFFFFFFSSRRRHTRFDCDWSSDVCSSDLRGALLPRRRSAIRSLRALTLNFKRRVAGLCGPVKPLVQHFVQKHRSEERRVGKECRSRWSPYQ